MPAYVEDPPEVLAKLGSICLALPDAYEEPAWAGTRWRIRKHTFAHVRTVDAHPTPITWLKFRSRGPEFDALLVQGHPFARGGSGTDVVSMILDGDTDWSEVAELLTESYRLFAPKRIVALLDDRREVTLPAAVRRDIERYLSAVDGALPGLVEGLYVTGSIPLGDYRPAVSDVDLVAVCAESPTAPHLQALTDLHRMTSPNVDVLYVTRRELAADPRELSSPYSLEGTFMPEGGFNGHLVTWRQLQTAAVAVRGTRLTGSAVWFDAGALRRWSLSNLDDYWRRWIDGWRGVEPSEAGIRHKSGLQWLVLGVPRLHYTIATLGVTSKTGAGHHALAAVDSRWHPVIEAAIALRADQTAPLSRPVQALHDEAAEISEWLIEDAHRLVDG